jgi:hypothetical protein
LLLFGNGGFAATIARLNGWSLIVVFLYLTALVFFVEIFGLVSHLNIFLFFLF